MVNLNSLVDDKPRVKKTEQPNEYTHLFSDRYTCKSGKSGEQYKLRVEENLVFYTCSCPQFAFNHACKHGIELCERIADGETFEKPRIWSETPFEFDNAPLLDSKPAKRKPTLEDFYSN